MTPAMMREKLRIIQRRCSPNRPAKIIRTAVQVVNSMARSKTVKPADATWPV